VNAIEDTAGEREPFSLRYLRNLAETGPEWTLGERPPSVVEREAEEREEASASEEEGNGVPVGEGPREITVEDTIIIDKRHQLILTQPEGDGVGTQARRYKHFLIVGMA
jgi:hypothetical protein